MTLQYTGDTDTEKHYFLLTVKSALKFLLWAALTGAVISTPIHAQREKLPTEDLAFVEKTWPEAKKTSMGIRYIIVREGTGPQAKAGDKVAVVYTGRLLNGQIFDQALDPAKPFVFRVRRGEVIEGWEQILQLMKVGEKRIVIIPPELGYGTRGQAPKIPRNSTLVFEMELKEIRAE